MPFTIVDVVRGDDAIEHLRSYFNEGPGRRYTGRRFEALSGGGDRPAVRNMITSDDLVAVQMLSVNVPAEAAIGLLDGSLGRRLSDLLSRIPAGVELGTDGARKHVAEGSAAALAWTLLKEQPGVGYVKAGKIMARKRPHLVPVYDRVVRCLFGRPRHVWPALHDLLASHHGELRHELAGARERAGLPSTISLIRTLDVVLWMSHHHSHVPGRSCPGFNSLLLWPARPT